VAVSVAVICDVCGAVITNDVDAVVSFLHIQEIAGGPVNSLCDLHADLLGREGMPPMPSDN